MGAQSHRQDSTCIPLERQRTGVGQPLSRGIGGSVHAPGTKWSRALGPQDHELGTEDMLVVAPEDLAEDALGRLPSRSSHQYLSYVRHMHALISRRWPFRVLMDRPID
uniref:Uncharacterized protein n=1 Tax=Arundo donax TaxID=35708 RepID=A0A0A9BGB0_ARUDO